MSLGCSSPKSLTQPSLHTSRKLTLIPIDVPSTNLRIFAAPKVATSSLKEFCLTISDNPTRSSSLAGVSKSRLRHKLLPNLEFDSEMFEEGKIPIALIRNPVSRFLSVYRNKVENPRGFHAKEWAIAADRGYAKPSNVEEFLVDLHHFSNICPGVGRHALPQVRWIGESPLVFSKVFYLERISQLENLISSTIGRQIHLPQLNTSPSSETRVSNVVHKLIKSEYALDFEFAQNAGISWSTSA